MILEVGRGLVWFDFGVRVRIDGEDGSIGAAFGVLAVYGGVVNKFGAF